MLAQRQLYFSLLDTRRKHEFAYKCATRALLNYSEKPDPRSLAAIEANQKWFEGKIEKEVLKKAQQKSFDVVSEKAIAYASSIPSTSNSELYVAQVAARVACLDGRIEGIEAVARMSIEAAACFMQANAEEITSKEERLQLADLIQLFTEQEQF